MVAVRLGVCQKGHSQKPTLQAITCCQRWWGIIPKSICGKSPIDKSNAGTVNWVPEKSFPHYPQEPGDAAGFLAIHHAC